MQKLFPRQLYGPVRRLHYTSPIFSPRIELPVSARRQNLLLFGVIVFCVSIDTVELVSQTTLRVGLVSSGPSSAAVSIDRGVRLGALEAQQTAKLFGGNVLLFEERAGATREAAAEKLLSQRKVQVLIGSSAKDADVLSRLAETHQIIFFNVASRSPRLRAACRRYTFHVEASDSMYETASERVPTSQAPANVVLWAGTLERYGASQINNRFRAKYQIPMDGARGPAGRRSKLRPRPRCACARLIRDSFSPTSRMRPRRSTATRVGPSAFVPRITNCDNLYM